MERSEPVFFPEWLKSNGNVSGGSVSNQHSSTSSSSHSGDHANVPPTRSKYSFTNGGYDSPRSVFSGSSYFDNRKPARSGSVIHKKYSSRPYSSFGRSCYDSDLDEDLFDFCNKERWFLGDRKDRNSNAFGVSVNSFVANGRIQSNKLKRSQSMISGKQGELCSRVLVDPRTDNDRDCSNVGEVKNGSIQKVTFESDFPSLGAGERPETPDIARDLPPSSSVQGLPFGPSAVTEHDGYVERLPIIVESTRMEHLAVQQHAPGSLLTAASSTNGLNMAKTLVEAPSRANSAPQVPMDTQRLEELAIKQSRQLIPLTSLVSKTSVSRSEKPKLRSEMKSGQRKLQSSQLGGQVKSDSCHVGKFLVLKPAQVKNGLASGDKDTPPVVAPPLRRSSNTEKPLMEKQQQLRPIASQAQSRSDFFNLMRKKSCVKLSKSADDGEAIEESQRIDKEKREKCSIPFEVVCCPDEEERAFLYSLGWEENVGEDDQGLTQDEINAFYKNLQVKQVKPSLKMSYNTICPTAELSSSDSDSDA